MKSYIPNPIDDQPLCEKFRTMLLVMFLFICGVTTLLIKANAVHGRELQSGIAQEIIRFHVIANSDSDEDQELKLLVRDNLVNHLSPILSKTDSILEAKDIIEQRLPYIQELAEDTVKENGYSYPVTVSLSQSYFPLKIYGDYTFPPGYYDALRVQIGEAQGRNWWCLMFPPLCFVDETYGIVDGNSGEKLKTLLTDEEYNTLISRKTPIKVKFKFLELLKNLLS